jgi:hypothetical protein
MGVKSPITGARSWSQRSDPDAASAMMRRNENRLQSRRGELVFALLKRNAWWHTQPVPGRKLKALALWMTTSGTSSWLPVKPKY